MMEKKMTKEEISIQMDKAAVDALMELRKIPKQHITIIGGWIKKHYLKAGYKRLCKRILEEMK
jgi:hypothetical protein